MPSLSVETIITAPQFTIQLFPVYSGENFFMTSLSHITVKCHDCLLQALGA